MQSETDGHGHGGFLLQIAKNRAAICHQTKENAGLMANDNFIYIKNKFSKNV